MKYYCSICDNPSWFYDEGAPDCYCEYCDKTYPSRISILTKKRLKTTVSGMLSMIGYMNISMNTGISER